MSPFVLFSNIVKLMALRATDIDASVADTFLRTRDVERLSSQPPSASCAPPDSDGPHSLSRMVDPGSV